MRVLFAALLFAAFISGSKAADQPDAAPANSDVRVLTDANFEHDTQASTGGTTGDWLVEFYAPWCGHCKKLAPIWEQVATDLKGSVNVAKLDATEHTYTARRFDVRGFPTIKLLHRGNMYDFNGQRTAKDLAEFASKTFETAASKPIPPPFGWFETIWDSITGTLSDVKILLSRKPEAMGLMFFLGLLFGVMIVLTIQLAFPELKLVDALNLRSPRPGRLGPGSPGLSPLSPAPSPPAAGTQPAQPAGRKGDSTKKDS